MFCTTLEKISTTDMKYTSNNENFSSKDTNNIFQI